MSDYLKETIHALHKRFGGEVGEYAGDPRLVLTANAILPVAAALRNEYGFEFLSDLTAVDYWPQLEPRFHIIYQFSSLANNCRLGVRVPVGEDEQVPTISEEYWSANWHEREIYDMFGVRFESHPDMRRILMPHDWEGHPLRKDYPLGYEEVQFSFNEEEIMKRKPHPQE